MAQQASIVIDVSFAWWLRPYLSVLVFFCLPHGSQPDPDRLRKVINRAVSIRVGG